MTITQISVLASPDPTGPASAGGETTTPGTAPASVGDFVQKKDLERLINDIVDQRIEKIINTVMGTAIAPFPAARARGVAYVKAELEKPDNLSLKDAGAYAGRSDRAINEARQRGALYALIQEGKTRGFRYPSWQFDVDGARLAKALQALDGFGVSCWIKHNFLLGESDHLAGRSPKDIISDPNAEIETVINAARARFSGQHGAF